MSSPKISARHALTDQEFDFCRKHLGGLKPATAYRRAFLVEAKDGMTYASLDAQGNGVGEAIPSKEVSRRANILLEQDHITAFLTSMDKTAGEHARSVLLEQALFEGDRGSAVKILEDEDKMGARDDYEYWAMVMCAIGAEVVITIDESTGEIVVPMKALFPQYTEALPPDDVVRKTIQTLEAYLTRETLQGEGARLGDSNDAQ
jgi:hypothetical protein